MSVKRRCTRKEYLASKPKTYAEWVEMYDNSDCFDVISSATEQATLASLDRKICMECISTKDLVRQERPTLDRHCSDYYLCRECIACWNNKIRLDIDSIERNDYGEYSPSEQQELIGDYKKGLYKEA